MSKNYYNFFLLTISRLLLLPIVFSLQIYTLSFNHFVGSTPLSQIISHVQSMTQQQISVSCAHAVLVIKSHKGQKV